jgi:fructose-specific phosphotransferase system IIC component
VRVCYDPGANHEPAPGRYIGSLWVSAPGAAAVPLTLEFTFRDNGLVGVFLALLLGILAGVVVQAIAAYQQAPKETRPKKLGPYLINFRTLLIVGAGIVAGATAYGRIESDPTWNSTVPTLLALAGATFGATLAAKTATDLKGPTEKEKTSGMAS